MRRREELESIVEAFAEYEGQHSHTMRFLIELVCDLQIALDEISHCETRTEARAIALQALEREKKGANHEPNKNRKQNVQLQ